MANMEDLLDLYAEPYDPRRPVVCFDETSTQLLAETRPSLPPRPGIPLRQDYEYRREGVRNLFLACEPLAGWRHVAVTQRRTMEDFAHQMRWLVDEAYPETPVVRVVMDNLNTHRPASLYESFPAAEARRDGQAGVEKNELKPWRKKEWCIPKVSAEFVACMEDVLDLYAEPYDPKRPVACFDETSKQLVSEKREPIPAKAGRRERFDYEYQRNGTRNLFMICEPLAGWRHVAVTGRRTMEDFAGRLRPSDALAGGCCLP